MKKFIFGIVLMLLGAGGFWFSGLSGIDIYWSLRNPQLASFRYLLWCLLIFLAGFLLTVWEAFLKDALQRRRSREIELKVYLNHSRVATLHCLGGDKKAALLARALELSEVQKALGGKEIISCSRGLLLYDELHLRTLN